MKSVSLVSSCCNLTSFFDNLLQMNETAVYSLLCSTSTREGIICVLMRRKVRKTPGRALARKRTTVSVLLFIVFMTAERTYLGWL